MERPAILIIIGITGDLARRKLLPALSRTASARALPREFCIIGVTRQKGVDIEHLLENVKEQTSVRECLSLFSMDMTNPEEYKRLGLEISNFEARIGSKAQRLFYLSVPPEITESIISNIGESGLAEIPETKILLEKPFGVDEVSATCMVDHIGKYFTEDQVYRIDHYLAKETSRNLIVFRNENSLFRRTWNNEFIERIEIEAHEEIGIEGRAHFYEQVGALRDVVQSHLLQLAALVLMDTSSMGSSSDIPLRRLAALKELSILDEDRIQEFAKRGQYASYRKEVANPKSNVETFVYIPLCSKSAQWKGIPIILSTGKKMRTKSTCIRVYYKKDRTTESNELVLRLHPQEGVEMHIWTKRPGYEEHLDKHMLDFTYAHHYASLPEAYEQVLLDALRGDHALFSSSDEVLESWRILAPLQKAWKRTNNDLILYTEGSELSDIVGKELKGLI